MDDQTYTRRIFLQRGMSFVSRATTAPLFIQRSAFGMLPPAGLSSQPGVPEDRVLVVVQLGGGNDGLNTVVPYGNDAYYKARPNLAVPAPGHGTARLPAALQVDGANGIGLHPSFSGFKELIRIGGMTHVRPARPIRQITSESRPKN